MAIWACQGQPSALGHWYGMVEFGGGALMVNFFLEESSGMLTGILESPDQSNAKRTFSKVVIEQSLVEMELDALQWSFSGKFDSGRNVLEGAIRQGGEAYPLTMQREPIAKKQYNRPQMPRSPFPYQIEEVQIPNGEHYLAGTLTYPSTGKPSGVVVLISGSGPQDRDETIAEHKPFWVIADYLTRRGIAVLRYDDRGVAQSTGTFKGATSLDFSHDAEAAVRFLQKHKAIRPDKIGLMGHSEGGMIAAMVAARNADVRFVVSLAGTALVGKEVLRIQTELISIVAGVPPATARQTAEQNQKIFSVALSEKDPVKVPDVLRAYFKKEHPEMDASLVERSIQTIADAWFLFFMAYDPSVDWARVKCPILAVNGSLDLQVTPEENLCGIANAANDGGNFDVTIEAFQGLNHLFQSTATGNIDEYAQLEETFSERVLERLAAWLDGVAK